MRAKVRDNARVGADIIRPRGTGQRVYDKTPLHATPSGSVGVVGCAFSTDM